MGTMERAVAKRVHKENIRLAILRSVLVAGVLATAVVAPNGLQFLRFVPGVKRRPPNFIRSLKRLVSQGYVREMRHNGTRSVALTERGTALIARLEAGEVRRRNPERWDGRWRIVIFDIPERRRNARIRLRSLLRTIRFLKLQGSVWIYPFDCEDVVRLIKTDFALGKEMLYIVAEEIEWADRLRKHFKVTSPK